MNDSPGRPEPLFVSAADGTARLAPGSIGTAFGQGLASGIVLNTSNPPPTMLGGVRLRVHDGDGNVSYAQLLYVSQSQINFVLPSDMAPGFATVTVDDGSEVPEEGRSVLVQPIAPSFFTADGSASGVPCAYVVRVDSGGTQTWTPAFTCTENRCSPALIDVRGPDSAFLILYGTGVRGTHFIPMQNRYDAYCWVTWPNGSDILDLSYVGPQGQFPGLDQVNIPLPSLLAGAGDATMTCTFNQSSGSALSSPLPLRFR